MKKLFQKGELPYEFIVRLIIALVFAFAAVAFGASFFRLTNEADSSYQDFLGKINSINNGEIKAQSLVIDDGTAIAIFDANQQTIKLITKSKNLNTPEEPVYSSQIYTIDRPASCSNLLSSCICKCGKVSYSGNILICDKLICEYSTFNFAGKCDNYFMSSYTGCTISGGALLSRGILSQKEPRLLTIYFERRDNLIGICDKTPCLEPITYTQSPDQIPVQPIN